MERKSRRPGMGDGSAVQLARRSAEPTATPTNPQQALLRAREAINRRAETAHWRARPIYRLMARFAEHESSKAHPAEVPAVMASLRAIWSAAVLIERRAAR